MSPCVAPARTLEERAEGAMRSAPDAAQVGTGGMSTVATGAPEGQPWASFLPPVREETTCGK